MVISDAAKEPFCRLIDKLAHLFGLTCWHGASCSVEENATSKQPSGCNQTQSRPVTVTGVRHHKPALCQHTLRSPLLDPPSGMLHEASVQLYTVYGTGHRVHQGSVEQTNEQAHLSQEGKWRKGLVEASNGVIRVVRYQYSSTSQSGPQRSAVI